MVYNVRPLFSFEAAYYVPCIDFFDNVRCVAKMRHIGVKFIELHLQLAAAFKRCFPLFVTGSEL